MSKLLPPAAARPPIVDAAPPDRTTKLSLRTRTFTARTVSECLQLAKQEMGVEAMILSKKTFRQGALFGRIGGREMVEVTFGTYRPAPGVSVTFQHSPVPAVPSSPAAEDNAAAQAAPASALQTLEAQVANLTESVQALLSGKGRATEKPAAFVSAPVTARSGSEAAPASEKPAKAPRRARRPTLAEAAPAPALPTEAYPTLMRQLLDAEVAAPLARQLVAAVPDGLSTGEAVSELRTLIAQRLRIANRLRTQPGEMRLLAFLGTTGVGKTTTIAKLAAQYALMERRRVGVITLDTYRIAAAQQLQTYGKLLRVPVLIAQDRTELVKHLEGFRAQGMELVLVDTAGRSPNDLLPLGETAHLLEGMGTAQKFLALPATLAARDMENIVARFQPILNPDALVLTKLDEATDNTCFGKLLTVQAKFGLPLAYVTTGQKVPDDITFPDAHAIASRILTTAVL